MRYNILREIKMITPEECLELTENEEELLKDLETVCDLRLRTEFVKSGRSVKISVSATPNVKVIDRLIAGYEASGWKVLCSDVSSISASYWLEFSERSATFKEAFGYGQR